MPNQTAAQPGRPTQTAQPAIDLHINGKGLLLSGAFDGWQSRLALGPDLDEVDLSLYVDATSVASDAQPPTDRLFSFRSKSVENRGKGRFRVLGDFHPMGVGGDSSRELAIDVATPLGHTALIALSFKARRDDFGSHWESVVENASLFGAERPAGEGPQREAAGWLTTPVLAAA